MHAPRSRIVAVLVALAVLLVSCSDDGGDDAGPAPDPTVATSEPTDAPDPGPDAVVEIEVAPGTADGFEGARDDVSELSCTQDGDAWIVAGVVTNSSDAPATYRIYTSFLDAGGTTLGLLQTDVGPVDAGATADLTGQLAVAGTDLTCTLRVERTAAR